MGVNPKVKKWEYGIKEMKTVNVYPLSIADQFSFEKILTEAFQNILKISSAGSNTESEDESAEILQTLFVSVKKNLDQIISIATGENGEEILKETDNEQFVEVLNIIFDVNFAGAAKNGMELWGKVKSLFPKATTTEIPDSQNL